MVIKEIEFENFIKIISSVVKMIKKGEKYNYNMYIQKVYDETEDIVKNYFKILLGSSSNGNSTNHTSPLFIN